LDAREQSEQLDGRKAPASVATATVAAAPEGVRVTLYFPNQRYIETGDESLDELVAEEQRLDVDAANVDSMALAVLSALEQGPTSSAAAPAIPERMVIRGVQVQGGVARVDLARAGLSGSSLEERLLVNSIVQSLTRLPDVRSVQFLVDGQVTETLMGHVSVKSPVAAPD
jgi:spore germination protein GerM